MRPNREVNRILAERFGKDALIALATIDRGRPEARYVDAYYEDGAFCIVTDARSGKMRQIADDPAAAVAGEWFTAHGRCASLGPFRRAENRDIAEKLRQIFTWPDNGHSDPEDENTVILRIDLTDAVLYADGTRYELEF